MQSFLDNTRYFVHRDRCYYNNYGISRPGGGEMKTIPSLNNLHKYHQQIIAQLDSDNVKQIKNILDIFLKDFNLLRKEKSISEEQVTIGNKDVSITQEDVNNIYGKIKNKLEKQGFSTYLFPTSDGNISTSKTLVKEPLKSPIENKSSYKRTLADIDTALKRLNKQIEQAKSQSLLDTTKVKTLMSEYNIAKKQLESFLKDLNKDKNQLFKGQEATAIIKDWQKTETGLKKNITNISDLIINVNRLLKYYNDIQVLFSANLYSKAGEESAEVILKEIGAFLGTELKGKPNQAFEGLKIFDSNKSAISDLLGLDKKTLKRNIYFKYNSEEVSISVKNLRSKFGMAKISARGKTTLQYLMDQLLSIGVKDSALMHWLNYIIYTRDSQTTAFNEDKISRLEELHKSVLTMMGALAISDALREDNKAQLFMYNERHGGGDLKVFLMSDVVKRILIDNTMKTLFSLSETEQGLMNIRENAWSVLKEQGDKGRGPYDKDGLSKALYNFKTFVHIKNLEYAIQKTKEKM